MKQNNNLFYQFKVDQSGDPLENLKRIKVSAQEEIPSIKDPEVQRDWKFKVKNIQDFLDFVEKDFGDQVVDYIEKTNEGPEGFGVGAVLLNILKYPESEMDAQNKEKVLSFLYPKGANKPSSVYLHKTLLSGIYTWWEGGGIREESFGRVLERKFRGFVKYKVSSSLEKLG